MNVLRKIAKFFTKKKIIWTIVILLVVVGIWYIFFAKKGNTSSAQTAIVAKQDLQETVLTTGQVVSGTDLSLSFQGGGVVRQVYVKEGDGVGIGQILATLDQAAAQATLTSAQGALAQAQASYEKLLAGATEQEIAVSRAAVAVSQVTVDNARQNILNKINNAYSDSYNAIINSVDAMFSNPSGENPTLTISGVTLNNQQLYFQINSARTKLNILFSSWKTEISSATKSSDLNQLALNATNNLSYVGSYVNDIITLLGSYSVANTTSGQTLLDADKAVVSAASNSINASILDVDAARQGLQTANSNLSQSQASLNLKTAPAAPADVNASKAQILSAQGQVDSARVVLNNLILRAPISGTITQVDVKVGEQATAMKQVMILQNVNDLHTETNVSEANVASLVVGQSIDYTFDALGPNRHFNGKLLTINPASIVVSGVVNYKATGSLDNVPEIKPGMTANMTILVAQKSGVIAVPSSAIIIKNSNQYVRVVDNPKTKTYHEVQVQTGMEADGGMVEIISGISEGQEIIIYSK
jgi:HlyD family secretion protein